MEVNKDEATRCLNIAQSHFDKANYSAAIKFASKSIALFPTDSAKALLTKALLTKAEAAEAQGPSSPSTAPTSPSVSSSSTSANGLRNREHKTPQREYSTDQVDAVKRIRACGNNYYKILSLEKECTEADVKRSYRKLALQFHPDKNGAPGADEAFKMISKAFTVLSDPQKRAVYNAGGMDPEQRSNNPGFSGMNGFSGRGGGPMFETEVSPEELFNMFFGGDFGGGGFGGGFQSATFVGPGFRTRTFRAQPNVRARNGEAGARTTTNSGWMTFLQLLPLLLLFFFSLTSSLFGGSSTSDEPSFAFERTPLYSVQRETRAHQVPYFINPAQFARHEQNPRRLNEFEHNVELYHVQKLQGMCRREYGDRQRRLNEARGSMFGIGYDEKKWNAAAAMKLESCERLKEFGVRP